MIINNTSNVYYVGRNININTYLASFRRFPILTVDDESSIIASYGVMETRINQIRFAVEKRLRKSKQSAYMVGA